MIKSGPELSESTLIPPLSKEEIHMSSLDQIPLRKGELGKTNESEMDLGLNTGVWIFLRKEKPLDDHLLLHLGSASKNLTPLPCTS